MMTVSFNLLEEAWIPCITGDGGFAEVSLRGLLAEAPRLREIACETALQSAAILPLALAVLHRVFGPAGLGEWKALWDAGAFDMARLDAYFGRWRQRFDLFHPERPFYQVADDRVKRKSILYLAEKIQNTHTLFNHTTEAQASALTPAQATRRLLQAQAFRLGGGRSGATTPNDVDSIYARGILFFAQGSNLFQTLMVNLVRYPDERLLPTSAEDKPFWEQGDPWKGRKPGSGRAKLTPRGYLDYLTWQTNHVEMFYESNDEVVEIGEITIVPVSEFTEDVRSPQKQYEKREEKRTIRYLPLKFREDKALWRNYHSLLPQPDDKFRPPAVIEWLSDLIMAGPLAEDFPVRLQATGMLASQTKPIFYRRESMPLPLELLRNPDQVQDIGEALKLAEGSADKLRNALNILANEVLLRGVEGRPDSKVRNNLVKQWQARQRYWIALEPEFWQFIDGLLADSEAAMAGWAQTLQATALEALRHAAQLAGASPWALKGAMAAERYLRRELKKLLAD